MPAKTTEMMRAGLTGGIACGKTVVATMMAEMGCHILNADSMAHQLIEPGRAAYDDLVREFGREILDAEGRVIRPRLAEIVFADPAKLARLNQIIHPRVLRDTDAELEALA